MIKGKRQPTLYQFDRPGVQVTHAGLRALYDEARDEMLVMHTKRNAVLAQMEYTRKIAEELESEAEQGEGVFKLWWRMYEEYESLSALVTDMHDEIARQEAYIEALKAKLR